MNRVVKHTNFSVCVCVCVSVDTRAHTMHLGPTTKCEADTSLKVSVRRPARTSSGDTDRASHVPADLTDK